MHDATTILWKVSGSNAWKYCTEMFSKFILQELLEGKGVNNNVDTSDIPNALLAMMSPSQDIE